MRLIDADTLKDTMCTKCANGEIIDNECNGSDCSMLREIESAPTIEAESVRHGRWLKYHTDYGAKYYCSACCINEIRVRTGEMFQIEEFVICPFCGAKMYQTGGTISKERFAEIMGGEYNEH